MITETIGFLNRKLVNFEAVMKIKNVFSERGTSSKFSIFRAVFNDSFQGKVSAQPHTSLCIHICITNKMCMHN